MSLRPCCRAGRGGPVRGAKFAAARAWLAVNPPERWEEQWRRVASPVVLGAATAAPLTAQAEHAPASYNGWFMRPISEIAERLVYPTTCSSMVDTAKLRLDRFPRRRGKLVLVTAITPDEAASKTVTTIRTHAGLVKRGHHAVAALREPSLGPVFGQKGGATGGGRALAPLDKINLHFTGDFHAHRRPQSVVGADRYPSALRQRAPARSQGNPVAARAGHERSGTAADRYRARWALQRSCPRDRLRDHGSVRDHGDRAVGKPR